MDKFWTITDADTTFTNSRSTRFTDYGRAVTAAKSRIENNSAHEVIILEAVAIVKPTHPPIEVVNL